jgi:CHAT domain-containing protein
MSQPRLRSTTQRRLTTWKPPFSAFLETLWEVDDRAYADLAQAFYGELVAADGTIDVNRSARAMDAAARRLRERYPHIPSLWAAHIHVGR